MRLSIGLLLLLSLAVAWRHGWRALWWRERAEHPTTTQWVVAVRWRPSSAPIIHGNVFAKGSGITGATPNGRTGS